MALGESDYIERGAVYGKLVVAVSDKREFEEAFRYVRNIPAADVRLVVHGKWEKDEEGNGYFCSLCGCGDFLFFNNKSWRFCPDCGALMDLEVDE